MATTVALHNRRENPYRVRLPGFLVNVFCFRTSRAFFCLIRDGADYRQVSTVHGSIWLAMGPAYLLDVVGLDYRRACHKRLWRRAFLNV